MLRRLVGLLLFAALATLAWYGYDQLNLLRRTAFWEFRYVALGCAVFLVLSLVQVVWDKVGKKG